MFLEFFLEFLVEWLDDLGVVVVVVVQGLEVLLKQDWQQLPEIELVGREVLEVLRSPQEMVQVVQVVQVVVQVVGGEPQLEERSLPVEVVALK